MIDPRLIISSEWLEITEAGEGEGWFKVFSSQNVLGEESIGLVSPVNSVPADVGSWIGAGYGLHSAAIDGSIGSTLYGVLVIVLASYSAACFCGGLETIFRGIGEEIVDDVVCIDIDDGGVFELFADGGELSSEECVVMKNCVVVGDGAAVLVEVIGGMGKKSEPEGPATLWRHVPHKNSSRTLIVQSLNSSRNRPRNLWNNGRLHLGGGQVKSHVSVAEVVSADLYGVYPALERFSAWEIA